MTTEAPIFGFNDARADIVRTVIDRVVLSTRDPLLALNDAAYHETKRLEGSRRPDDLRELGEWQKLARSLARTSDAERRQRRVVEGLGAGDVTDADRDMVEHRRLSFGWTTPGSLRGGN